MNVESRERWQLGWFVSLGMLLVAAHQLLLPFACDDAYIHFRVAERFIETGRPYYNAADPVIASSSPVWTIALTICFALFGVSPAVVAGLNAVLTAGVCVMAARLVAALCGQRSLLLDISVSVAVLTLVVVPSIELMETPLALFLLCWGILRVLANQPRGFLLLGFALCTRLELAVFPLLLSVLLWRRERHAFGASLMELFMSVVPFLVYHLMFFGALLPQTLRAKHLVYGLGLPEFASNLTEAVYGAVMAGGGALIPRFHVLVLLMVAMGAVLLFRRERFALPWYTVLIPVGGLIILDVYAFVGVPLFEWYNPLYQVPMVLGVVAAAWGYRGFIGHCLLWVMLLPPLATLGLVLGGAFVDETLFPGYEKGLRVQQYLQVGESLRQRYPDGVLAAAEVGALGFAFRGRVLDGVGLISPQALAFHPLPIPSERANRFIGALPAKLVATERPLLVVGYDPFLRGFLGGPEHEQYQVDELTTLPPLRWGALRVFIRRNNQDERSLVSGAK